MNRKLNVLIFLILPKHTSQKVDFFKFLKGRYFLLVGCRNIIFGLFLYIQVELVKNANSIL